VDIKILYMVNALVLLGTSLVLYVNYKKYSQNISLKFLTYFMGFHLFGFILFILRNQIPDFISIVIANSFFATGVLCLYMTIRAITKVEPVWHNRYFIPLLTYFVGFVIFTYVSYDTKTRILIYYLFCTIFMIPSAWFLWKNNVSKYKVFDKSTAILFFTISLILIWIIIQVSFIKLQTYYFSNSNIFMMLSFFIMNILSVWSLLALRYRIKN